LSVCQLQPVPVYSKSQETASTSAHLPTFLFYVQVTVQAMGPETATETAMGTVVEVETGTEVGMGMATMGESCCKATMVAMM
jgi:hypothetical protein